MKDLLQAQQKLIPDLIDKMYKRFSILTTISKNQPVGRRSLSEHMDMTERVLRSETDMLKKQALIKVKPTGMEITAEGEQLISQLKGYFDIYADDNRLSEGIKNKFQIKEVHVVPGDADNSQSVKTELGRQAGQLLEGILQEDAIVAVTGGSTMACVSEAIHLLPYNVFFVPARGGLGENVVFQANTIAASMAQQAGGYYTTMYVPDNVSETTYNTLLLEPSVINTLDKIKQANVILHGIGDALKMAHRRQSPEKVIEQLQHHQAVGEAFGYYFDTQGQIVHKVKTIGLQLEDLESKDFIFAVAGGKSKGEAIKAYLTIAPKNTVLITDEAAAKIILE
ncbi:sugar-binding transcriptional regulator [Staphylococcus aureus]|uniref:sugar-binding domain-containing protein n=1 Tax=Staphylococcus aureus TaxID=1280 RepID=UPI001F2A3763|nr:sugar-binding transcriptional regulator [Staphylococcus aureus]UIZ19962.1 sugar-binding transcriptional regulator [Staphylococcus aureus]